MFAQMQKANVAGRTVAFAQDGDPASSRVLVLIHAFPVGVGLFEPQRGAFPRWRVIVPALPGFDGSDRLEADTVDASARQVLALLDQLGVDRAVVGGVSMGGYVAFGMLRQAARRVAGLVLANTRSAADAPDARPARERLLLLADSSGSAAVAAEMLPKLLGRQTVDDHPEVVAETRRMIERQDRAGLAAGVRLLMSRPDSTPLLGRIAVPTLVIIGEEDTLTPPAEMESMAAAIPGAAIVRIAAAGHLSNLEAPDAFNRAVRQFLDRIDAADRR